MEIKCDLEFSDFIDKDGDIEVHLGDSYDYINKSHAILIIKHLTKVFEITKEELYE